MQRAPLVRYEQHISDDRRFLALAFQYAASGNHLCTLVFPARNAEAEAVPGPMGQDHSPRECQVGVVRSSQLLHVEPLGHRRRPGEEEADWQGPLQF